MTDKEYIDDLERRIIEHGIEAKQNDRAYTYITQKMNPDIEMLDIIRGILKKNMTDLVNRLEYIGIEANQALNEQDRIRVLNALKEAQKKYNKR